MGIDFAERIFIMKNYSAPEFTELAVSGETLTLNSGDNGNGKWEAYLYWGNHNSGSHSVLGIRIKTTNYRHGGKISGRAVFNSAMYPSVDMCIYGQSPSCTFAQTDGYTGDINWTFDHATKTISFEASFPTNPSENKDYKFGSFSFTKAAGGGWTAWIPGGGGGNDSVAIPDVFSLELKFN